MKFLSYLLAGVLSLSMTSCLKQEDGQYIPGVNGPKVNIQDGKILLSVELENIGIGAGITVGIPKMQYSEVTVSPSVTSSGGDGTLIRVHFDLRDVESDAFKVVPHQALPDGRPFPFLVDGALPALAFQLAKVKNTTFYASNKVFGFFIPINLPDDFDISVHYRIKINGKSYGVVSLIHPDASGEGAGIVALLTLDDVRRSPDLQKILKISKRNKNRIY